MVQLEDWKVRMRIGSPHTEPHAQSYYMCQEDIFSCLTDFLQRPIDYVSWCRQRNLLAKMLLGCSWLFLTLFVSKFVLPLWWPLLMIDILVEGKELTGSAKRCLR